MHFGLAKLQTFATGSQSGTPALSAVATMASIASPVTVAGTLVGTVQYMSPEQIQGKEADARSDIFAFGVAALPLCGLWAAIHMTPESRAMRK